MSNQQVNRFGGNGRNDSIDLTNLSREKQPSRLERLNTAVTTVLYLLDVFHKTSAETDWLCEVDRLCAGIRMLLMEEAGYACFLGKRARLAKEVDRCPYPKDLAAGLLHQAYYVAYRGKSCDKTENPATENSDTENSEGSNNQVSVIPPKVGETT